MRRILPADRSIESGSCTIAATVTPMRFLINVDSWGPACAASDSATPVRRSTWTAS